MASYKKRINSKGKLRWTAVVRVKGHPPSSATFPRKHDAEEWALATEKDIRDGIHGFKREAKRRTVSEMIDRYVDTVLPRKKPLTQEKQRGQYRVWKELLGEHTLSAITPARLSTIRDDMLQLRAPATVNRYFAALSHCCEIAVREWEWLEKNPCRRLANLKEPRGRDRFLSEDEKARLLDVSQACRAPYFHPIVMLALSTGMRQGEILGIERKDLDLHIGQVRLHNTKNGTSRTVPIRGKALEALQAYIISQPAHISGRIFPISPETVKAIWRRERVKANLEDVRFHDLRHTAASYLAMNGASLLDIAEILGHKTLAMVQRYAHLTESHLGDVVEAMNEKFLE